MDPIWELKNRKVLVQGGGALKFLNLNLRGLENVDQLCDFVAMIDKIDSLDFADSDLTDAGLAKLKTVSKIGELLLTYSNVSAEGYGLLKPEWGLIEIHVNPETDPDLVAKYVSKLSTLEVIGFQDCELTDKGLEEFSKLTRLRKLSVERTKIHKALELLVNSCPLTELSVGETEVDDDACIAIAKMQKLKHLAASETKITDKGLGLISELHDLEWLAIGSNSITGEGLSKLSQLPKLKTLRLWHTNLNENEVKMLCNLIRLEKLVLSSSKISKDNLAKIRHQLPKCEVISYGNSDESEQ